MRSNRWLKKLFLDRQPRSEKVSILVHEARPSSPELMSVMDTLVPPIPTPVSEKEIVWDFPACLAEEFPQEFPAAWRATEKILTAIAGGDFSVLARHSPGLKDYPWPIYLRCSLARLVRTAALLRSRHMTGGKLLDFGSYFGNFSLMFADLGFQVNALDYYMEYGPPFDGILETFSSAGVPVVDFARVGQDLGGLGAASYDVVLCMGVIEHIPHTPRLALQSMQRVLKPGGLLVMDTPNLAYIYKRQRLQRGLSVFPDIAIQYVTEIPFNGHHREYTAEEMKWMIEQLGHEDITIDMYNYSMYGISALRGIDYDNYQICLDDPSCRELILTVSRKV